MRRVIAVGTVVATLAVPTIAGAGFETSAAPAKGGKLSVKFTVLKQGGKPVGVDDFRVRRLPMICEEGDATLRFSLAARRAPYFPVNNRDKFKAIGKRSKSKVKIIGKFVTNNKVRGRVKAEGDFPSSSLSGCIGSKGFQAG